jgi:hypothetical protein
MNNIRVLRSWLLKGFLSSLEIFSGGLEISNLKHLLTKYPQQCCTGYRYFSTVRDGHIKKSKSECRLRKLKYFSVADPGCLDVYPGSEFFSIPDPKFSITDSGSVAKNLSILTQKTVSKLSEI